jgi:hypothetical protein
MEISLREAAAMIGHRSPSTLYRWRIDGRLSHAGYLRGEAGRWRIETDPPGLRPFANWAAGALGPQGPIRREDPPEPPARDPVADELGWWAQWGRVVDPDEEPLSDAEHWEHLSRMVSALMGKAYGPAELAELSRQVDEVSEAVNAGARWDAACWDAASARSLLEDPDVMSGCCLLPELQSLADGGRLPADLQARADEALAAYRARQTVKATGWAVRRGTGGDP